MSSALLPGRILLVDSSLFVPWASRPNWLVDAPSPRPGDVGGSCTSVSGGGLGRRGELDGEAGVAEVVVVIVGD